MSEGRRRLIVFRRGTAAQWTSVNPVLAEGELGYETNTRKAKIGNGTHAWNSLSYINNWGGSGGGGGSTWGDISGDIADQDDLITALAGKQPAGNYALASHTHDISISDVSGLQEALDGKQNTGSYFPGGW